MKYAKNIRKKMEINKFQKLKENKYKVFFQNREEVLYDDIIIKYNLLVNKIIDDTLLNKILKENNALDAYYLSIKYIDKRLRSEKEITNYLLKKQFDDKIIADTILKLRESNYLNSKLYLNSFINDQINLTLNGPYKIINMLSELGFLESDITNLLKEYDDKWLDRIKKYVNKKIKLNHKRSNYDFKAKIKSELINMGYQIDLINEVLNDIELNDEDTFMKNAEHIYNKYINKYEYNKFIYLFKNKLYALGYSQDLINKYLENKK